MTAPRAVKTENTPCSAGVAVPDRNVWGRLNGFQRTMLQWNDLHPYSAVHVMRIPGLPDPKRLREAINGCLEARGLTGLVIDRRKQEYLYLGGPVDAVLKVLPAATGRGVSLADEIESQLNTPFPASERFEPFRFFVAPEEDGFWLGLAYFHPAADAESVAWLLKDLTSTYQGRQEARSLMPLDRYPRCPDRLLLRQPGTLLRALAALPSMILSTRRSCRPPCRDSGDSHNGFRLMTLPGDCLQRISAAARRWSVTFNDLVLAALLQSLSPLATARRQARRRRQLSVGVIVNLRPQLGVDGPRTFGLLLGSFRVTHEVPDGMRLSELARAVNQQTGRAKRARVSLATPIQLAFARFMFSRFSLERRQKFYSKNYPLWGGVTNMNLNALWNLSSDDGPADYVRAVSTGPATPFVLSLTTIRDRVNIGLSYRSAVFSEAEVDRVQEGLARTLGQPEGSA